MSGVVISDCLVLRLSDANAEANGETIEAALSVVAGVASADAEAEGVALDVEPSIFAGVAAGSAAAAGTVLAVASSILAGVASPQEGVAVGATIVVACSIIAGSAAGVTLITQRRQMTSVVRNPPYRDPFYPAARGGRVPSIYRPKR